jgi:hypothetical protein
MPVYALRRNWLRSITGMAHDGDFGSMKIAYVGNLGGQFVLDFYAFMTRGMQEAGFNAEHVFLTSIDQEKKVLIDQGFDESKIYSFEEWVRGRQWKENDVDRLREQYRDANWSAVLASERSFTDYSLLLGSAGHRPVSHQYVMELLVSIVTFFEHVFKKEGPQAIVCQTGDTLFSHAVFKVAQQLGTRVFAITPAWLLEPGRQGGYFSNNEYMESDKMLDAYKRVKSRELTEVEQARVKAFVDNIMTFRNKTAFTEKVRERNAGFHALSPNFRRLFSYLAENARRDTKIQYTKVSPQHKAKGNALRVWRKYFSRGMYGRTDCKDIPQRSVFFAFQYQPEQSTLTQGIFYANQVALVENISKSLPLGYTLVVKEHPWGRGARPVWQYRHLAGLYNVRFCDAPSKEIIRHVEAVIAISGTVGFESLVLEKPTVVLGRTFFTHCDLLYVVKAIQDLPAVLRSILVDRTFDAIADRSARRDRFLFSYLESLIPYFPIGENGKQYGEALARELGLKQANETIIPAMAQ